MPHKSPPSTDARMLERLKAARASVAQLVVEDPIYAPIFARLEAEIVAEETMGDPIAYARAIIAARL